MPKPKHRGGVWTGSTYEQQCVGQNGAGTCERNVHKQFWTRDEKFQVRKVGANKRKRVQGGVCAREAHTSSKALDEMVLAFARPTYGGGGNQCGT
jgi:hypothetical protein